MSFEVQLDRTPDVVISMGSKSKESDALSSTTTMALNATHRRPTLQTLPPEILYLIFGKLEKEESVYAGITCAMLYSIHWHMHGKVTLAYFKPLPGWRESYMVYLYHKLQDWMAERGYAYCVWRDMYRPLEILQKEDPYSFGEAFSTRNKGDDLAKGKFE